MKSRNSYFVSSNIKYALFASVLDSGFQTLAVLLLIFILLFRTIATQHYLMKRDDIGIAFFVIAGIIVIAALVNAILDDPRLGGFFLADERYILWIHRDTAFSCT